MRRTIPLALAALAVLVLSCGRNVPREAGLAAQVADLQRQVSELRTKVEDLEKFIGPRKWYQGASLPEALRSLQSRIDDRNR